MESKLIDYRKVLFEEKGKLDSILPNYQTSCEDVKIAVDKISEIYANDFANRKPRIMVFGIYNAGKSSIINELLHDDKAKVADIPTTDKIDTFEWRGYQLSDTPGIAAPIEHQKVTMEALKDNDVVIFVMSTSGSNEKLENYKRIKEIIELGKKVIIVLNDKNGYLCSSSEVGSEESKQLEQIKTQVVKNMEDIGIVGADKYALVVVNAKLAEQGRKENVKEFIELSNFGELERAVLSELKDTQSYDLLRTDIKNIIANVELAVKAISNLSGSDVVSQKLNALQEMIHNYKSSIRSEMQNYIESQKVVIARDLPDLIWQNKDNQEAINEEIGKKIDTVVERVGKKMSQEFDALKGSLDTDLRNLINDLEKIDVQFNPNISVKRSTSEKIASTGSFNFDPDKLKELIDELKLLWDIINPGKPRIPGVPPRIPGIPIDPVTPSNLFTELLDPKLAVNLIQNNLLSNLAASAAKGALESVSGKVITDALMKNSIGKIVASGLAKVGIGGIVPYVGPIITVVMTLMDLFKDNEQERAAEENERRRMIAEAEAKAKQELQQKCVYMAEDFADELSLSVNDIIIKTCNDLQDKLNEQSTKFTGEKNNVEKDIIQLRIISSEYHGLLLEIC